MARAAGNVPAASLRLFMDPETNVHELGLTPRAYNVLAWAQITTVGQLVQLSKREIARKRNMGKMTIAIIREKLRAHGLDLRCDTEVDQLRSEVGKLKAKIAKLEADIAAQQHRIAFLQINP